MAMMLHGRHNVQLDVTPSQVTNTYNMSSHNHPAHYYMLMFLSIKGNHPQEILSGNRVRQRTMKPARRARIHRRREDFFLGFGFGFGGSPNGPCTRCPRASNRKQCSGG